MSELTITANLGFSNQKFHVGLSLVEFNEDDIVIIYSPALDLSGYGHSKSLHEFFRYTHNKNTLDKVLKDLGWSIKGTKKKPKFNPPLDSDLVSSNSLYNEIVNNKSYKVSREQVEFAL